MCTLLLRDSILQISTLALHFTSKFALFIQIAFSEKDGCKIASLCKMHFSCSLVLPIWLLRWGGGWGRVYLGVGVAVEKSGQGARYMATCKTHFFPAANGVLQTLQNCTVQTTQNCLQANVPALRLPYCEERSWPSVEHRSHKSPVQTKFSLQLTTQ